MSSNCPPQLHLSISSNPSFKRSFEEYGFDLDSSVNSGSLEASGSSGSGSRSSAASSASDGAERRKRARSTSSLSSTGNDSTGSTMLSEYETAGSTGSTSVSSNDDGIDTLSQARVFGVSSMPADPPALDQESVMLSPESQDAEMSDSSEMSFTRPHSLSPPLGSPSSSEENYRRTLERYNEFDSHISVLRRSQSRPRSPSPSSRPVLPPIQVPAELDEDEYRDPGFSSWLPSNLNLITDSYTPWSSYGRTSSPANAGNDGLPGIGDIQVAPRRSASASSAARHSAEPPSRSGRSIPRSDNSPLLHHYDSFQSPDAPIHRHPDRRHSDSPPDIFHLVGTSRPISSQGPREPFLASVASQDAHTAMLESRDDASVSDPRFVSEYVHNSAQAEYGIPSWDLWDSEAPLPRRPSMPPHNVVTSSTLVPPVVSSRPATSTRFFMGNRSPSDADPTRATVTESAHPNELYESLNARYADLLTVQELFSGDLRRLNRLTSSLSQLNNTRRLAQERRPAPTNSSHSESFSQTTSLRQGLPSGILSSGIQDRDTQRAGTDGIRRRRSGWRTVVDPATRMGSRGFLSGATGGVSHTHHLSSHPPDYASSARVALNTSNATSGSEWRPRMQSTGLALPSMSSLLSARLRPFHAAPQDNISSPSSHTLFSGAAAGRARPSSLWRHSIGRLNSERERIGQESQRESRTSATFPPLPAAPFASQTSRHNAAGRFTSLPSFGSDVDLDISSPFENVPGTHPSSTQPLMSILDSERRGEQRFFSPLRTEGQFTSDRANELAALDRYASESIDVDQDNTDSAPSSLGNEDSHSEQRHRRLRSISAAFSSAFPINRNSSPVLQSPRFGSASDNAHAAIPGVPYRRRVPASSVDTSPLWTSPSTPSRDADLNAGHSAPRSGASLYDNIDTQSYRDGPFRDSIQRFVQRSQTRDRQQRREQNGRPFRSIDSLSPVILDVDYDAELMALRDAERGESRSSSSFAHPLSRLDGGDQQTSYRNALPDGPTPPSTRSAWTPLSTLEYARTSARPDSISNVDELRSEGLVSPQASSLDENPSLRPPYSWAHRGWSSSSVSSRTGSAANHTAEPPLSPRRNRLEHLRDSFHHLLPRTASSNRYGRRETEAARNTDSDGGARRRMLDLFDTDEATRVNERLAIERIQDRLPANWLDADVEAEEDTSSSTQFRNRFSLYNRRPPLRRTSPPRNGFTGASRPSAESFYGRVNRASSNSPPPFRDPNLQSLEDRSRLRALRQRFLDRNGFFDRSIDSPWNVESRRSHMMRFTRNFGDYIRDEDFDASYESLLALASTLGEVKPKATSDRTIASLPTGLYQDWVKADSDERCPICLDDYEPSDQVMKLADCPHWLHKGCLEQWLHSANTCPVCRKKVGLPRRPQQAQSPVAGPSRLPFTSRDDNEMDDGAGGSNSRASGNTGPAFSGDPPPWRLW